VHGKIAIVRRRRRQQRMSNDGLRARRPDYANQFDRGDAQYRVLALVLMLVLVACVLLMLRVRYRCGGVGGVRTDC